MKDELNSVPLEEVVASHPKCYCLKYHGKVSDNVLEHSKLEEKPTAAGTKRNVKEKNLIFDHYLKMLTNISYYT